MPYTELFANNAPNTTVAASKTAPAALTSESWTVGSSTGFSAASTSPAPGSRFRIVDPAAPSEIMLVTNVSGTAWTVIRGWESTTPVTHASGFTVYQVISAENMAWATDAGRISIMPSGAIAETFSRNLWTTSGISGGGIIGRVYMVAIWLQQNMTISNISFPVAATASGTLTHYWVGLADSTGLQLCHSTDLTSGTLAATTLKTSALTAPFVTTYTGLHYVLMSVSASTTTPTFGTSAGTASGISGITPYLAGTSASTQAAPGTDGSTSYTIPTAAGTALYAYLS